MGVTVAFSFLFVRELVPRPAWAPVVGGLAVALQPELAFIGGAVNNDNGLVAASAVVFWLLAASFRRGLTPARAAAIGALCAAGVLAKLSMLGLLPGVAFGLLALAWRDRGAGFDVAVRRIGIAAAAFALPLAAVWLASRLAWDRSLFGSAQAVASGATAAGGHGGGGGLRGLLSYTWQFYLPALPGMHAWLGGYPLWDAYFVGFVGRFGWQDTQFPLWVYDVALSVALLLVALSAAGLVSARASLRRRLPELLTYVLMTTGLLAIVAVAAFSYINDTGDRFEQGRYLLSLIPLYGAFVAVAVRGAGRRLGPYVAIALVTILGLHAVLAQLLAIGRYYL
jgi:predicted membrane protein DUF2142